MTDRKKETVGLLAFDPNPAPQSLFYRHPYVESRKQSGVSMAYGQWEVPHLLDLLHPDLKPRDLHEALTALADRMSQQEQKAQALAEGGAEKVTALLKHADSRVKKLACDLVGQFSTLLQGREKLAAAGAVAQLGELLLDGASGSTEASIGKALNMFACMPHSCHHIEEQCIVALLKYIKARFKVGEEKSYRKANVDFLECLEKVIMATRSDKLLGTGLIAKLVAMLGNPMSAEPQNKDMTAAIMNLIRALGTYHARGRQEILEGDNINTLIKAMHLSDTSCREMATAVLAVVCLELNAKKAMQPAAFRLWELYTNEGETPFCRKMALQTIRTAQEWDPFRRHFVEQVLSSVGEDSYAELETIFGIHLIRTVYALVKAAGADGPSADPIVTSGVGLLLFVAPKEPSAGDVVSGTLALSPETPPESTATYIWETLPDFVPFMVDILASHNVRSHTKEQAEELLKFVIGKEPRAKAELKSHESRLPSDVKL